MRVLYLDIDTLRPDHLGCYGYQRNTSPNIDRIASQGTRCDNFYCSDAPCLPSRAALFSGQFGIHSGAVNHGGTNADFRLEGPERGFKSTLGREALPFIFREMGMKTVSISTHGERHSLWGYYAGFNEMHNIGKSGSESAEEVTPEALKWIEGNGENDNWFMHLHYWDPHTPYRAPEEFGNPFENEPLPEWITEDVFKEHLNAVGPHTAQEIAMYSNKSRAAFPRQPGGISEYSELRKVIDGYDCGIRYMDEHFGRVLDALDKKGVLDDLVIIISSDHGENLGELGIYAEHGTSDYMTHRIPMIIRWPGTPEGQVDRGLHYNIDLCPTLAELAGTEPFDSWDGESFAESIKSGADRGRDYLVLSQCCHVCQRSVRFGPWFYIRTYHDGYHLFPKEMLFNIEEDPFEQHNLAETRRDITTQAVYMLNEWHDEMMSTSVSDTDPLWSVMKEGGPFHANRRMPLEQYCEHLRNTGRAWALDELKKAHPGDFADF